jgi:hypothetical protein
MGQNASLGILTKRNIPSENNATGIYAWGYFRNSLLYSIQKKCEADGTSVVKILSCLPRQNLVSACSAENICKFLITSQFMSLIA